jgi:hypothetical protein
MAIGRDLIDPRTIHLELLAVSTSGLQRFVSPAMALDSVTTECYSELHARIRHAQDNREAIQSQERAY